MNELFELFKSLFGEYSPIQSLVSGTVEDGTAVYEYSVDFGYIVHGIIIIVTFYSIMRLIGILLERK